MSCRVVIASRRLVCYRPSVSVTLNQTRPFSDESNKKKGFRPRRRPSASYRPVKPDPIKRRDWLPNNDNKFVTLGEVKDADDELEREYGPVAASVLKDIEREGMRAGENRVEEELRLADYLISESGTLEDLIHQRRMVAEALTEEEHEKFMDDLNEFMLDGEEELMHPDEDNFYPHKPKKHEQAAMDIMSMGGDDDEGDLESEDPELRLDPNQLVHGDWSEMLVTVGRTTKLWRGGRLESYRALVIGGNANGCGGFGVGKSWDPALAVDVAGKSK